MKTSKTCPTCGETKPITEFHNGPSRPGGLQSHCIPCKTAMNDERMYVNGKYVSKASPLYKPGRFKTLDDAYSHDELEKVTNGYVYVMINPAFPGWVKVGSAVSMSDRENSYQTGDPFRQYKMYGGVFTEDRVQLERKCHEHCERSAQERRGEWFKINEVHALNIIRKEARNETSSHQLRDAG